MARSKLSQIRVKSDGASPWQRNLLIIFGGLTLLVIIAVAWLLLGPIFMPAPISTPTFVVIPTATTVPVLTIPTQVTPTLPVVNTNTPIPPTPKIYLYGRAAVQNWTFKQPTSNRDVSLRNSSFVMVGFCLRIQEEKRDDAGALWYFIQFSPNWGNSGWLPQSEIKDISTVSCTP